MWGWNAGGRSKSINFLFSLIVSAMQLHSLPGLVEEDVT